MCGTGAGGVVRPEDLPDGGRPADMVIYRLHVEGSGLEQGPAELREVVRRVMERGEEAARQRASRVRAAGGS